MTRKTFLKVAEILMDHLIKNKASQSKMPKALIKTPFQFSQINSYLYKREGKKHFWGIKGKDYGLIESPQTRQKRHSDYVLPQIKREHVTYNPYVANPPYKHQRFSTVEHFQERRSPENEKSQIRNKYHDSDKPNHKIYLKTQPIQAMLPPRHQNFEKKQQKKPHLSLLTKNINLNVHQQNSLQKQRQKARKQDYFLNRGQNINNNQSAFFQEKPRQPRQRFKSELNSYELDQFRDRIVKVVKKDRRNNPTFCNSLGYPLPCYRYLQ